MIRVEIKPSVKLTEDFSIFVSFEYNQTVVDLIRSFPTKYWLADIKTWELPVAKLADLVNNLPQFTFDITGSYVSLAKPKAEVPADFKFKTEPFEHQITGFNYGLTNNRWLLGDEQGLGKTKQVIDIAVAKKLQKGYKHCLIVCGVNGLKWNWSDEIKTHSDESGYILGQRRRTNGKLVIGSVKDRLDDLNNIEANSSYFLITNVESLRNEAIATKLNELCKDKTIGVVAIDEIHKCKNHQSQQGKGILKLESECKIAMTGTPLMNTPLDLYIILKWLGYEKHAFYSFKNHYSILGGFNGKEVVGYKHLDELQERLDTVMLRRLKKDVLDLPEKLCITEYVEMTAKQAQIYKEVSTDLVMNIDNIAMSSHPLAQLIRLRQVTGYTGILSSLIRESAKLDRMEELVEEAVDNGKKVVIFSNWTQMVDIIEERLDKYNPAVITGETPDSARQSEVERFQTDASVKVIIGTIGAMGTGLTLTAGTVEIFVDEPWTKAAKNQAEDRCHRIGAKENVTIYTLICKDTIDERVNTLVEKKGAMSDALVDGKIVGSKTELLNYLLS